MRKKSKYGMPSPETRNDFEHNINLTIDEINKSTNKSLLQNRMMVMGDSLQKLHKLPNGRINPITVDEKIRLHSNTLDWQKYFPAEWVNKIVKEKDGM